jgi:putative addiction module killer protein
LPIAKQYEDADGRSPFEQWFLNLHPPAAAKVTGAVIRMEQGNFSNAKGVGLGVFEYRIDFGPGYRIYFGKDGDQLIILAAERRKNKRGISTLQWNDGTTTNDEKSEGHLNGFDQRFQNNCSSPGTA